MSLFGNFFTTFQLPAQPPTMVYWSALATWRILRALPNGSIPSRQNIHRLIALRTTHQQLHDDDKQLLIENEPLFSSVPEPPEAWRDSSMGLNFDLTEPERRYLRGCFLSVGRPDKNDTPSLLSRLVEQRVEITDRLEMSSVRIRAAADAVERAALLRAHQAAALSAIGRAVYAALVEEMRAKYDKMPTADIHRSNLRNVVDQYVTEGRALDIEAILQHDAPSLSGGILEVLRATRSWLLERNRDISGLYAVYERAESNRKRRRARLTKNLAGREKRAEWLPDQHPTASPLHYRWGKVRQLLMDLQERK